MGAETLKLNKKIGFIGGGNMAKAIFGGVLKKGIIDGNNVYVSGPNIENLAYWKAAGAHVTTCNGDVVKCCDVIFLAVKPQILPEALAHVYETVTTPVSSKLFVSVLAGIPLLQLENALKGPLEACRIVRVMPNTPMMVGAGCTVFCPGQKATKDDVELVQAILSASGICKQVPESMIDAIGALSGSGPAFIYLMIEALSDGGVRMGIPRQMATDFAANTVLGAAKMVIETGRHTGQLKDDVCSAGGTTITGIHALERGGVRGAIMDAIEAATNKSRELGKKQHTT